MKSEQVTAVVIIFLVCLTVMVRGCQDMDIRKSEHRHEVFKEKCEQPV